MDNIISIITPSYNQGEYLAETIESVLSQEGDFHLDYILVDGGSTDSSVEIIRQFDERLREGSWPVSCRSIGFRWISERDRGQADALAKGFALAAGEIVGWLNSDDLYLPGALQTVLGQFRAAPATALVYGDADYCDRQGAPLGSYRTGPYDFPRLAWFNFVCQPAAFFRRSALQAVGGIDQTLHFAMDYDLWVRIGSRFPCAYLQKRLAVYRLHESSKSVKPLTLFENAEEALAVALKYFGWAPLTRVYNCCSLYLQARLPGGLGRCRPLLIAATLGATLLRSLWLNRGIRAADLALLNAENFAKIFKSRMEIMTGGRKR
jgi:glycosyltransferase involved in cell wall biosynthesis